MADAEVSNQDLDWLERDRHIITGLDHLGVQTVSIGLYTLLLPGITNVTDRARYYSFYPWVLHRFAQRERPKWGRTEWLSWFRRLDFAFCMASVAHAIKSNSFDSRATAVVGADTARRILKGVSDGGFVDFGSATDLDGSGKVPKKGAYFQNSEGGLGQYYKGSLRDLGLLQSDTEHHYPDVRLTTYAGVPVAESIEGNSAFGELVELATVGKGRLAELASLGARVSPSGIKRRSREETLLRALFVAEDDDLCRAQNRSSRAWRRALIQLALTYARDSEFVEGAFDHEFRWACLAEALPDGRQWVLPQSLKPVASAWGAYQRNDLLNHALECLFWLVLRRIDAGPLTPQQVVDHVARLACAGIAATDDEPSQPPIDGTVSQWIAACERTVGRIEAGPWDETSTWSWAEALDAALGDENDAAVAAWAARLLGRLASDSGRFSKHPFETVPQAAEMAAAHEIHLQSWLDRLKARSSEPAQSFIAEVILEWTVYRHLRVATRKLAAQGVSTFKTRPERGRLVLASEDIPLPTFTSPRLRQAHRILADLHLLEVDQEGTRISGDGEKLLQDLS
jgi:hypothetical protein